MRWNRFFTFWKRTTTEERKFETFIKVSKTGAWEYFPQTGKLWFSEEYFRMLDRDIRDYEPFNQSALQRCWIDLLHDDDRKSALETFDSYLKNPEQTLYENYFRLKKTDGTYAWILSRALKMVHSNGAVEKIIGTHINISELKELERRKIEYEKQLSRSRKLEALGTLSGGIAHDFNNILAAILGNTDLAKLYVNQPEEQLRCLELIEEASLKGKSMVEEILNFARTDTDRYKIITVGPIIREVASFIQPTIPEGIELITHIHSDLPILGDQVQLYQVLINLCTNSVQAFETPSGKIEVTLSGKEFDTQITSSYSDITPGKYLQLEIRDNGKGMDENTVEKIFEPFFTTKKKTGTGLGMFLVYGIIKSHGGSISVYSEPGSGAKFTLLFPRAEESTEPSGLSEESLVRYNGKGKTAVVVDDDESLCFILQSILEENDFRVQAFTSPEKAFEVITAASGTADIIVSDVHMPVLSGYALMRKLKEAGCTVPVVLCSGLMSETDKLPTDIEPAGVIQKPFSGREVLETVSAVLFSEQD